MKRSTNLWLSGGLAVIQAALQSSLPLPVEARIGLLVVHGGLEAILKAIAASYNPDGTSARAAYQKF